MKLKAEEEVTQISEDPATKAEISKMDKQKINYLKDEIFDKFADLLQNNKEIQNFEYEVEFKKDMDVFRQ